MSSTTKEKFSFDKETVKKILKGALYATSGAAAIGLLQYLGDIQISNPTLAAFTVWIVPVAINAIKEWMSGKK